jgi:AAA+ superfamily predicted ATPase
MAKEIRRTVGWSKHPNGAYRPAGMQVDTMSPGVYNVEMDSFTGLNFMPVDVQSEPLIAVGNTAAVVTNQIQRFLASEDKFRQYQIAYKRGILLHGKPGNGKSCLIRIVANAITGIGGVTLMLSNPEDFENAYTTFRGIEPNTPILAVFEDLDGLIRSWGEESLTNAMDGMKEIHRIVFVASTNFLGRLSKRVLRPSRFDLIIEVGCPNVDARRKYLQHLAKGENVGSWAEKTKGLTFADLKELFVSVNILGADFDQVVKRLAEATSAEEDDDR